MPVKVVVMRKVMMTIITHDYDDKNVNIFFVQYLNKQTTALREVNDSRLRIYEQVFTSEYMCGDKTGDNAHVWQFLLIL